MVFILRRGPGLSPGHTMSGSNGTVTASTTARQNKYIRHGAVDIHFIHSSAIGGPSLAITPAADIVCACDQLFSDATASLVDPQHALWVLDWFIANTTTADSTGTFDRFLEDIMTKTRDQELGLPNVDTETFTFHASLLRIELGDTFLLGIRDEHQVISVEKLPRHTSAEPTRKNLQYQDEEQWAKNKAHQIPHHTPRCTAHWPAHDSIGHPLAYDRNLPQGRRRQSRAIC